MNAPALSLRPDLRFSQSTLKAPPLAYPPLTEERKFFPRPVLAEYLLCPTLLAEISETEIVPVVRRTYCVRGEMLLIDTVVPDFHSVEPGTPLWLALERESSQLLEVTCRDRWGSGILVALSGKTGVYNYELHPCQRCGQSPADEIGGQILCSPCLARLLPY